MAISNIFDIFSMGFVLLSLNPVFAADDCERGYYFVTSENASQHCLPCESGTYMPENRHNFSDCFPCSQVTDPGMETLITQCSATDDADIVCTQGFFRVNGTSEKPGSCNKCQDCTDPLYTSQQCSKYLDAVCCPGENYDVILKEGIPECSIYCGKGQYLDTSVNSCVPCPDNTYMDEDKHLFHDCKLCKEVETAGEKIVQTCNATHQTQIGCNDSYYLHVIADNDQHCEKCRDCQDTQDKYIGRNCTMHINTVCCSNPNMIVSDGHNGPVCEDTDQDSRSSSGMRPAAVSQMEVQCKENQYLNTSSEKCLPCPDQTYVEDTNHTYTSCNNCSNFQGTSLPTNCASAKPRGLTIGEIAVIAVGAIVVLAIAVTLLRCLCRRCCKKRRYYDVDYTMANEAKKGEPLSSQNKPGHSDLPSTNGQKKKGRPKRAPEKSDLHSSPAPGSSTTPVAENGPDSDRPPGPDDKSPPLSPTNHVDNTLEPEEDPLLSPNPDQFPAGDEDLEDNPSDKSRIRRGFSIPSIFTVSKFGNIDSALSYATLQDVDIEQPPQTPSKSALKPKKAISYKNLSPPRVDINNI